jgi:hypothetical protein
MRNYIGGDAERNSCNWTDPAPYGVLRVQPLGLARRAYLIRAKEIGAPVADPNVRLAGLARYDQTN